MTALDPALAPPARCLAPRRGALAIHTAILVAFLAASSTPTPLYRLYQQAWGFSSTILTIIFAAYALALLCTLLLAGSLSDYIGRRPVIALALLLEMTAMAIFLLAGSPAWLIAARIVQGIATGLAAAAVGAALLDLNRERGPLVNSIAPMVGMAIGALGSTGVLVHAAAPLRTSYLILLVVFAAALAALRLTPETAARQPGAWASLKPSMHVPRQARGAFWSVTPVNVSVWMLGGLYLSQMPSLIAQTTHSTSPWLGGLAVAALTLSGAVAVLAAQRAAAFSTLVGGAAALTLGLLLILVGANSGSGMWLLGGSLVAGAGFGSAFLGAVRTVLPLAGPSQRASLMATFYVESYLAHSVPAIAAGYFAQRHGLLATANFYGLAVALLALAAIALALARSRGQRRAA
ncbi:MFS transporter [Bordetella petrii]|uniref:MFS transporter n=1 Tax=Bordetella petrii TaxID=94624 RepID=UPI00372E4F51